jgi:hypothetical protein
MEKYQGNSGKKEREGDLIFIAIVFPVGSIFNVLYRKV